MFRVAFKIASISCLFVALLVSGAGRAVASHALPIVSPTQQNGNGSALCTGCTAATTTVVFNGSSDASTFGGLDYTMQLELRPLGTPFTGVANYSSYLGSKQNSVTMPYPPITAANLAAGQYHWQVREFVGGVGSAWSPYSAGNLAFIVGVPSMVSVNPNNVMIGNVPVGTGGTSQNITVTASGGPAQIKSITIAAPFSINGPALPLTLQNGQSTTFTVTFSPNMAGMAMGTVTITSDAQNSPATVLVSGNGTVPQMVLSPSSFDFGQVPVGTASTAQNFTVSNTGTAPLTVTSAALSGPFALQNVPPLPFTIPPGGSGMVQATFNPTQVGTVSGGVTIKSNDPNSPITLVLVGTGTSLGLNPTPNPLTYGNVAIAGMGLARNITFTSNTNQPITVSSITLAGMAPEWTINNPPVLPLIVPPMGSFTLNVTLNPQAHGARMTSLTVVSDAPNSPANVVLSGVGVGPKIAATPSPLDFGAVSVGQTALLVLTVQNLGETPLSVMSASFSGANGMDWSTPSSFPAMVNPMGTAQVAVRFKPGASGNRMGKVTLVSNDALNPALDVVLTGVGATPMITVMPQPADFGPVNVGSQSAPLPITIGNAGGGALTITGMSLGGNDAAAFQFTAPALPIVIPPGGSRTVSPVFAPINVGKANAKLTLVTDDPNAKNLDVALTGVGLAPMVSVDATMIDFGSQIVGHTSQAKMLNVKNAGTAPLTLLSLSISGPQGQSFSIMNPPKLPITIAPGMSTPVALLHSPMAVGMDSARLIIGTDDPMAPATAVTLVGTGVSTVIGVSPMLIDFGSIRAPGKSGAMAVTITNTGGDPITLVDAAIGGTSASSFSVDSAAGVLAPGAMKTVNVTFMPMATGDFSANAVFAASDNTIPPATVKLVGKGAAAKLVASPGTLDFGNVFVGQTSMPKTVTLTNVSSGAAKIMSVTSDMPGFVVAGVDTTTNLAPNGKTTFTVTFAPAAEGAAKGNLSVTVSGAASAEVIIPATGNGLALSEADAGAGPAMHASGCDVGSRTKGNVAPALGLLLVGLALVVRRRRG